MMFHDLLNTFKFGLFLNLLNANKPNIVLYYKN